MLSFIHQKIRVFAFILFINHENIKSCTFDHISKNLYFESSGYSKRKSIIYTSRLISMNISIDLHFFFIVIVKLTIML